MPDQPSHRSGSGVPDGSRRPVVDLVLDCTGLRCPMPVIEVATAIRGIGVGQVVEVLATDPGAEPDLTAWARMTGHEFLGATREGDVVRVVIRRRR